MNSLWPFQLQSLLIEFIPLRRPEHFSLQNWGHVRITREVDFFCFFQLNTVFYFCQVLISHQISSSLAVTWSMLHDFFLSCSRFNCVANYSATSSCTLTLGVSFLLDICPIAISNKITIKNLGIIYNLQLFWILLPMFWLVRFNPPFISWGPHWHSL